MTQLTISFEYDTVTGYYSGRANGGQKFTFSAHRDAHIPREMVNALQALAKLTMIEARNPDRIQHEEQLPLGEVLRKVAEWERRGGKVQLVGVQPKKPLTELTLDDLGDLTDD